MPKYHVEEIWFKDPLPVRMDNAHSPTALSPQHNKHSTVWEGEFDSEKRLVKLRLRFKGKKTRYQLPAEAVRLMSLGGVKGRSLNQPLEIPEEPAQE